MFGGIGVLAGNGSKWFCIPLHINLQDGIQTILSWKAKGEKPPTHVVQMIENSHNTARTFGRSIFLLDRYFLSVPALQKLEQCNQSGDGIMHLVTKAKKSCNAYEQPGERKSGCGRPAKKGNNLKLKELFSSKSKLKRYLKKGEKPPIEESHHPKEQKRIERTVKAIEGYVMFSCIAMGLPQMVSLSFSKEILAKPFRFLWTPSKAIVSEATVMCYLQQNIFRIMAQKPHLDITRFIQAKQDLPL